jgi:predicted CopG family antitoxin
MKKYNYKTTKLDIEVHQELEKIKAKLIGQTGNPNMSFSDIIHHLIKFYNEHTKEGITT